MLRLQKKNNQTPASLNLMPMLDVVFLILIFFLLTSIVTTKPVLKLDLPEANAAKNSQDLHATEIIIRQNGEIRLAEKRIDIPELARWLQEKKASQPQERILISADKNAPFGVFVQVLELLQKGQFDQVDILTAPRSSP